MMRFYYSGVLAAFCMVMYIFIKSKPWAEDDGQAKDARTTCGVIFSCFLCITLVASLSWISAAFLFIKRFREMNEKK